MKVDCAVEIKSLMCGKMWTNFKWEVPKFMKGRSKRNEQGNVIQRMEYQDDLNMVERWEKKCQENMYSGIMYLVFCKR